MFTKAFLVDAAERVVTTFVQAFAAAVVVSGNFNLTSLEVAAVAAGLAVAKVVAAGSLFGTKGDASLVK